MVSENLMQAERRARFRYEWSRARRAILGFAPSIVVVIAAALLGSNPIAAAVFGGAMFAGGAWLLWYGRDLKRAVLPGLVAGIMPLTVILCAKHLGHTCAGDSCMTLCLPACILGGLAAGLAVAAIGHRGQHGLGFWLAASGIALLTGAMGSACVGFSGLMGLVIGYGVGIVPAAARALFARRRS